jgi:hypothetical protein
MLPIPLLRDRCASQWSTDDSFDWVDKFDVMENEVYHVRLFRPYLARPAWADKLPMARFPLHTSPLPHGQASCPWHAGAALPFAAGSRSHSVVRNAG